VVLAGRSSHFLNLCEQLVFSYEMKVAFGAGPSEFAFQETRECRDGKLHLLGWNNAFHFSVCELP
jgi:hypothetical protein